MLRLLSLLFALASGGAFAAQPAAIAGQLAEAAAAAGALIFNQCAAACHTTGAGEPHRIGPNLWEIVGRAVASADGFDYSDALRTLNGNWDFEALNEFLYAPVAYAPGTRMVFPGIKDDGQRANLIAYLRALSETPVELPKAVAGGPAKATADPFGASWPGGPGREITGYTCNACHSLAIVKQQSLSREVWDELLDWMVEEQGMAEFDAEKRQQVLDYLASNFGIDSRNR